MKAAVIFAALATLATSSQAATWTNGTQIVMDVIWKPGVKGFYASTTTGHDPEGCGSGSLYVIDPTLDEKTVDRLFAILLAAQTTGKRIYVWVDGCSGSWPKFSGLEIRGE